MLRLGLFVTWVVICVAAVLHADCPPISRDETPPLYLELQTAKSAQEAQKISAKLWEIWLTAPDEPAQELLNDALGLREIGDYLTAIKILDRLIAYCPEYAEGHNQRAFMYFLVQNYGAALVDVDNALAKNSRHLGALTGKALILIALKRPSEADLVLRQALALNPWLAERRFLSGLGAQEL